MGRRALVIVITAALLAAAAPATAQAAQVSPDRATEILGSLQIPGIAWGSDHVTGQIVVTVDDTVTGARLESVHAAIAPIRKSVRVEREPGELRVLIAGGQAIYSGSGGRCSLGANARRGTAYYFVTAGHCSTGSTTWYADPNRTIVLGSTAGTSFPGNDYGIIRYTNSNVRHPSAVYTYPGLLNIRGAGSAYVGQAVCRSGSTTGVRCGTVTGLNMTVNYAQGTVSGLIRTNICAEPGDSGGPLYDPSTGLVLGILSGGSGNCSTGGTTYYQPIREILAVYGLTIP